MTPRAVFAGLATLDIVQLVERLPHPDEKVAALDFLVAAGGPAANAAVAFAHCGGEALLVTALPAHTMSPLIEQDLNTHGVDVSVAAAYDGAPITASIMVTRATGERAVVSPTGTATNANPGPTALPDLDGVGASQVGASQVGAVMLDGYFRAIGLPLASAARERGIPVILDAGSHKHYTDEVVAAVDVAVVSQDFAPPGTDGAPGAVFTYLRGLGVTHAAITRGGREILYVTPSGTGSVPVGRVEVVDTLGAGDFFHGALTYRIASLGLDDARFAEDLAYAARVAGESLGSFGTRAWLAGGNLDDRSGV
ncbi:PfkB family carbohydrate kinase [Demequina lutea]|uniref:Sugar/nucleoside kinase (Ribokinase family) n=1 Tax=Demequina lutea TaxID=431489 RepID=A0A7Y9Z9X3_9MICO|nr:PfkB family carbohydrate kinase [Demequina lutea]NYI40925.1 sugar/nucleoside kinase (ribokinase family) [Demequina lutea]